MKVETATILQHHPISSDYRLLVVEAPAIAATARPGQFVHLLVPRLDGAVLRRPFSLLRAHGSTVSMLYKQVGRGTRALAGVACGETVSLIGPLGNGFPCDHADTLPVLVAGGYGVAPLCFLAERLPRKGLIFIGARNRDDILCRAEFEALGWQIQVATEDGSIGARGLVTAPLDAWLAQRGWDAPPEFYACGPDGLLRAVETRAVQNGRPAWLSLDKHMGCGVGACLACVQRIQLEDGTETWARVCREGPVFEAGKILWHPGAKA